MTTATLPYNELASTAVEWRTDIKSKQEGHFNHYWATVYEYIKDLESQGDKIGKNTKEKINRIVSESIPHTDKELLLHTMGKFKELIKKTY